MCLYSHIQLLQLTIYAQISHLMSGRTSVYNSQMWCGSYVGIGHWSAGPTQCWTCSLQDKCLPCLQISGALSIHHIHTQTYLSHTCSKATPTPIPAAYYFLN